MLGGLLMIVLMFCLEERNIAIVLARLRVIPFSMHQFKKLEHMYDEFCISGLLNVHVPFCPISVVV